MANSKKPELCMVLKEAQQYGDCVHLDLCYPRNSGEPVKAIVVGLMDVRAADDIRIEYDFDRDGWRILARRYPGEDHPYPIDDCHYEERAFVPAWRSGSVFRDCHEPSQATDANEAVAAMLAMRPDGG